MQDSLQSSDQTLEVQSPTVKKFFTNVGFLSRLITGPYWALNLVAIFSLGVLPLRFPDITIPKERNYFIIVLSHNLFLFHKNFSIIIKFVIEFVSLIYFLHLKFYFLLL